AVIAGQPFAAEVEVSAGQAAQVGAVAPLVALGDIVLADGLRAGAVVELTARAAQGAGVAEEIAVERAVAFDARQGVAVAVLVLCFDRAVAAGGEAVGVAVAGDELAAPAKRELFVEVVGTHLIGAAEVAISIARAAP